MYGMGYGGMSGACCPQPVAPVAALWRWSWCRDRCRNYCNRYFDSYRFRCHLLINTITERLSPLNMGVAFQ